jgi:hypothetical protein
MTSRVFYLLLASILIMLGLFFIVPDQFESADQKLLFPTLHEALNDVDTVTVTGAGSTVIATVQRGDSVWTLAERAGYRANVATVRRNLIGLADAQIIEEKTSEPEQYARLGVEDIDNPDAAGTRLTIESAEQSFDLIVGTTGVRGDLAYVRRFGEAQSFLVSADLELNSDTGTWLETALLDVPAADIRRITVTHPDGEELNIGRDQAGMDLAVLNLPTDRELSNPAVADPIAGVLTDLTLDNVIAATAFDHEAFDPVVTRFETFGGLTIETTAYQTGDGIRVKFDIGTSEVASPTDEPAIDPQARESLEARADELRTKTDGWIYTLPSFKAEQLVKRQADLLK